MERENDWSGEGNMYTTEFRMLDPRLGRWVSLDPLMDMFPDISPYVAFANNPIYFIDPYGLAPSTSDGEPDPINYTNQEYGSSTQESYERSLLPSCPQDGQIVNISYSNSVITRQYAFNGSSNNWESSYSVDGGNSYIGHGRSTDIPCGEIENEQLAQIAPSGEQMAQQSSSSSPAPLSGGPPKSGVQKSVEKIRNTFNNIVDKVESVAKKIDEDYTFKSIRAIVGMGEVAVNWRQKKLSNSIDALKKNLSKPALAKKAEKAISSLKDSKMLIGTVGKKLIKPLGAVVSVVEFAKNPSWKAAGKALVDTAVSAISVAFPIVGLVHFGGSLFGLW